ncbi:hypothetical protein PR202_ga10197 [Eleusine coracana subsp. coracana]|uniref:AAA+ ATPase domain-containing protein n=1 Tax=Eleusine coracana subsp. coracana TaxID=191504 RepID=A0AAV5C665_ELECO|nr:hypothetical protein PR202_ga10197 [Eleusine coracana subsp. coracana]
MPPSKPKRRRGGATSRGRKKHKRLDAIHDVARAPPPPSPGGIGGGDGEDSDAEARRRSTRVRRAPVLLDTSPLPSPRHKRPRGGGGGGFGSSGGSRRRSKGRSRDEVDDREMEGEEDEDDDGGNVVWRSRLRDRVKGKAKLGSRARSLYFGEEDYEYREEEGEEEGDDDDEEAGMVVVDVREGAEDEDAGEEIGGFRSQGRELRDREINLTIDLNVESHGSVEGVNVVGAEEGESGGRAEDKVAAGGEEEENSIVGMRNDLEGGKVEEMVEECGLQREEKAEELELPVPGGGNNGDELACDQGNKDVGARNSGGIERLGVQREQFAEESDLAIEQQMEVDRPGPVEQEEDAQRGEKMDHDPDVVLTRDGPKEKIRKSPVSDEKLGVKVVKEGRRCGLCGGGTDGKPPKIALHDAVDSDNEAYEGALPSEEPNYDMWDGFGDDPGWLGRLLGPIHDRFGIARIWVHQNCAVWSPEPCSRAEACVFDHRKFLIACNDHRHLFQPEGDKYIELIRKMKIKKMKADIRKLSHDAWRKDREAEEKWLENCGEDEEFLKREGKRLNRDLLRIAPVYIGGSAENEKLYQGWESVAGLSDVIQSMKEVVILPLLYPEFFSSLGLAPPRGILLHGHPGTGKTLVVRALIGACSQGNRRIAYFARKGADCLVIGATNRPDAIDSALRRPGRFDREIYFPLPTFENRSAILSLHTKNWPSPISGAFLSLIASQTVGYAGADLQAICTQAAINALKRTCPLHEILQSAEKGVEHGRVLLPSVLVEERDWLMALAVAPPPCSQREAGIAANDLVSSPLDSCLTVIHKLDLATMAQEGNGDILTGLTQILFLYAFGLSSISRFLLPNVRHRFSPEPELASIASLSSTSARGGAGWGRAGSEAEGEARGEVAGDGRKKEKRGDGESGLGARRSGLGARRRGEAQGEVAGDGRKKEKRGDRGSGLGARRNVAKRAGGEAEHGGAGWGRGGARRSGLGARRRGEGGGWLATGGRRRSPLLTLGFKIFLVDCFSWDDMIDSCALRLSHDLIQHHVQFLHERSHKNNHDEQKEVFASMEISAPGEPKASKNEQPPGIASRENLTQLAPSSFLQESAPNVKDRDENVQKIGFEDTIQRNPSNRVVKGNESLAIMSFGIQILQHPQFSKLCWVTSKLQEGPCTDINGPWKGWPFNSCLLHNTTSSDNDKSLNVGSNVVKGKEKTLRVRGLAAIGLLAYRGFYSSVIEVCADVRKVLGLWAYTFQRFHIDNTTRTRSKKISNQGRSCPDECQSTNASVQIDPSGNPTVAQDIPAQNTLDHEAVPTRPDEMQDNSVRRSPDRFEIHTVACDPGDDHVTSIAGRDAAEHNLVHSVPPAVNRGNSTQFDTATNDEKSNGANNDEKILESTSYEENCRSDIQIYENTESIEHLNDLQRAENSVASADNTEISRNNVSAEAHVGNNELKMNNPLDDLVSGHLINGNLQDNTKNPSLPKFPCLYKCCSACFRAVYKMVHDNLSNSLSPNHCLTVDDMHDILSSWSLSLLSTVRKHYSTQDMVNCEENFGKMQNQETRLEHCACQIDALLPRECICHMEGNDDDEATSTNPHSLFGQRLNYFFKDGVWMPSDDTSETTLHCSFGDYAFAQY